MKISKIVSRTNDIMGSGSKTYGQIADYLDECIDTINEVFGISLPLISEVYENDFPTNEYETELTFEDNSENNYYTRVPDAYIRNYICYQTAYKVLRDQDEPDEVTYPKLAHGQEWYKRMLANFADFTLEDTESIALNGDVDELEETSAEDDTALGYYNPYAETE